MKPLRALALTGLALAGCSGPPAGESVRLSGYRPATEEGLRAAGWRTELGRREVPLEAIRTAGLSPSTFVPVRAPRHLAAAAIDLDPAEPVLVVRGESEVRAWPLCWLLTRELAVDEIEGTPVAVTFCSLCSISRVLDRRLGDEVLDLAVSGLLIDGNSLLFDRGTESLWRQRDGTAIVGAHTGRRLAEIPSFVVSFGELRRAQPDARVMREPDPVPVLPFTRMTAENVASGEPPAWLGLSCPRPLEMTLMADGTSAVLASTGPRVENLPGLVAFRDPSCAAAYRAADGRAGAITGSLAVFRRTLDGGPLTFEARGAEIFDRETGSRWNLLGEGVEGPLAGRQLEVAPQSQGFRFAVAGA